MNYPIAFCLYGIFVILVTGSCICLTLPKEEPVEVTPDNPTRKVHIVGVSKKTNQEDIAIISI